MAEPRHFLHGLERPEVLQARMDDWRCGPVVYQVFVDRFALSADLQAKRDLYRSPRVLRQWSEQPRVGKYLQKHAVWSHELEFWGGDLPALIDRVDYLVQLGIHCLYLNPIHQSFTNHKYDATDYRRVSPEYGSREDLKLLIERLHDQDIRLMLDGVFNHMGVQSDWFQTAWEDSSSNEHEYFEFDQQYPHGFRAWHGVANLAELRLESRVLREQLWLRDDSVVASFLKDGVDGWRLDVAYDIGPDLLQELTEAAHRVKPDCWIIGEIWSYPSGWVDSMDGLMNFTPRQLTHHMLRGHMSGAQAGRLLARQTADAGVDALLRSWLILDNHDTSRLRTSFPEQRDRRFAQTLQFTLPGSPCLYYGVELGMSGGSDPEMRAPMAWQNVSDDNSELQWMRKLITIRQRHQALRYGSIRYLPSDSLLAFVRFTNRSFETVLVVANPSDQELRDVLCPEIPWLLNFTMFHDELDLYQAQMRCGMLDITVPARSVRVLRPQSRARDGYDPAKRVP